LRRIKEQNWRNVEACEVPQGREAREASITAELWPKVPETGHVQTKGLEGLRAEEQGVV
jgi:hypothetical protein